jgi:glucokinase
VADLVGVVAELCRRVDGVVAVGVGLPGLVDHRGTLRTAPHIPGVVDLDVGASLAAATGLAVAADNDATCALVAEHRLGAARGSTDAVLVTLGTGIGGALLLGGQVQRGTSGFAGELGHMVVEPGGRPCPCRQWGCWEGYASGQALDRLAAEAGGDPRADLLGPLAGWVALGLANLVHVLDVERVVVGGGLSELGERLLAPVRAAFLERVMAPAHRPPVAIVGAEWGERAGAVGAALLAREVETRQGGSAPGR